MIPALGLIAGLVLAVWIGARISAPEGAAHRNEEGAPGNPGLGDAGLPEALGPAVRRTAGVSSRRRQP